MDPQMKFVRIVVLGLGTALLAGAAQPQDPVRYRPDSFSGLTDAERKNASYAELRFGPGDPDVILFAFLSESPEEPANELVFRIPGHPSLGTPQRKAAERRRRNDTGPALFQDILSISLNRETPPNQLEILTLEKRTGQGLLLATVRLSNGTNPGAPALQLQGAWRRTSGGRTVLARRLLDVTSQPGLRLRALRQGEVLYAALQFGDWDIVFPDRRPGIPVQLLNSRGLVIETETLRPTDDIIERIYNWSTEFRKLRSGESYTCRARIRPGPGYPEITESLSLDIPKIP